MFLKLYKKELEYKKCFVFIRCALDFRKSKKLHSILQKQDLQRKVSTDPKQEDTLFGELAK